DLLYSRCRRAETGCHRCSSSIPGGCHCPARPCRSDTRPPFQADSSVEAARYQAGLDNRAPPQAFGGARYDSCPCSCGHANNCHLQLYPEVRMGLLDKIFDKDDDNERKEAAAAKSAEKPRADFSNVQGASSSTADAAPAAVRTYTVKSGDSLSKIARSELGDASKWPEIFEANRDKISNPDLIHPGQVLNLPSK